MKKSDSSGIYVKNATYRDASEVKILLQSVNVMINLSRLIDRIELIFNGNAHHLYIVKDDIELLGLAVVHFLPRLTCEGYLTYVDYLIVSDSAKAQSSLKALEAHIFKESELRNYDEIRIDSDNCYLPKSLPGSLLGNKALGKYYFKKISGREQF